MRTMKEKRTQRTKAQNHRAPTSGIRFTDDDRKIISALKAKLGVDTTQIIRLGIRALADKEAVR
jgi:hypothetical protein